jgi:hypothetical protein
MSVLVLAEVLGDETSRKRYDHWVAERGPDADYPEGYDWRVIDQQIGTEA